MNMSDYLAIADTYHDFTGSRCKLTDIAKNFNNLDGVDQQKLDSILAGFQTDVENKTMAYLKDTDIKFDFEDGENENFTLFEDIDKSLDTDLLYKCIVGDDNKPPPVCEAGQVMSPDAASHIISLN